MYIADYKNNRIRKVTVSTGIITSIAGTGSGNAGYSGDDGQATSAATKRPIGVNIDTSGAAIYTSFPFSLFLLAYDSILPLGNVYFADEYNHRIRKVTVSTGIITTVAGSSTSGSYSGDNSQATSSLLNYPSGVALDSSGIPIILSFTLISSN